MRACAAHKCTTILTLSPLLSGRFSRLAVNSYRASQPTSARTPSRDWPARPCATGEMVHPSGEGYRMAMPNHLRELFSPTSDKPASRWAIHPPLESRGFLAVVL